MPTHWLLWWPKKMAARKERSFAMAVPGNNQIFSKTDQVFLKRTMPAIHKPPLAHSNHWKSQSLMKPVRDVLDDSDSITRHTVSADLHTGNGHSR